MRYLKSAAFLLLAIGSSAFVLSRSAIAHIAEEADSTSLPDEPIANPSATEEAEESAVGSDPVQLDLESLLNSVQRSTLGNRIGSQSKNEETAASEDTASKETATDLSNRLSLAQFRALAEATYSASTSSAADTAETAVADRTTAQNRTEQVAQTEDLPVLEEGTPPATAAPGEPVPSDPGAPDSPPNNEVPGSGGIQSGPDVVQPIPDDAPVEGAEPELGDLPDPWPRYV